MNLNHLMAENRIKPKELSSQLDISLSTLNSILYNQKNNPTLATLNALADYFCVSIDQLTGKEPLSIGRLKGSFNPDAISIKQVPLLTLEQIALWNDGKLSLDDFNQHQFTATHFNTSSKTYAVRIIGESMKPRFGEGNILILEPSIEPKDQDIVIVQFQHTEGAVFRQIFFDGNESFFKPINPEFGKLSLNNNYEILGVMVCAYINR